MISITKCEKIVDGLSVTENESEKLKEYVTLEIFRAQVERDLRQVCTDEEICARVEINRRLAEIRTR